MQGTFDIPVSRETRPAPKEQKLRGPFGLILTDDSELLYETEDGLGGISREGRGWFAWRGEDSTSRTSMREAAQFARRG